MLEILLFILIGCIIGCFTGLVPGIHSNNLVLLIFLFAGFPAMNACALILSAALTHSFVDSIPSILLGAPEEETVFSALAGHKFFLEGNGVQAIHLTVIGGFVAGIICFFFAGMFFLFMNKFEELIPLVIPFILISVLFLMIFEKNNLNSIKWNLTIISLSGLLGVISLNAGTGFALMAGISGLFGASNAFYSLLFPPKIKEQKKETTEIKLNECIKWSSFSALFGFFTALLPAITSGQSSLIAGKLSKMNAENYLIFSGGINTSAQLMSLIVFYAIGKTRTGTALGISQLIELDLMQLIELSLIALIVLGIAAMLTEFLALKAINSMNKINYSYLNLTVIFLLTVFSFFFAGINGLILFFTSSATGVLCISLGIRKSNLMAFLLIPTILIYLNIII
ncbi:MAG: tripartite tricarboxylate transporter permease [Candidatus Diapherotrites archaeon]|nr:tripartite tricarboxylate transporter permease [Candidatus Diapherotrites archaeon]